MSFLQLVGSQRSLESGSPPSTDPGPGDNSFRLLGHSIKPGEFTSKRCLTTPSIEPEASYESIMDLKASAKVEKFLHLANGLGKLGLPARANQLCPAIRDVFIMKDLNPRAPLALEQFPSPFGNEAPVHDLGVDHP